MFQNKSLIPWFNYTPTQEAIDKTKAVLINSARQAGKEFNRSRSRRCGSWYT